MKKLKLAFKTTLLLLITSFFFGCKKENPVDSDQPVESFAPGFDSVKAEAFDLLSFDVAYKITENHSKSGIIYATDSVSITQNKGAKFSNKTVSNKQIFRVELPSYAPKHKVWFKVFYIKNTGETVFSAAYLYDCPTYIVRNKNVVTGSGLLNAHPKENIITYGNNPFRGMDNSLNVDTYNMDGYSTSYSATINDIPSSLDSIDRFSNRVKQTLFFNVPESVPLGNAVFKLYYKNKLVYTENLKIINGGILLKSRYPINDEGYFFTFDHFVQGNNLYFYTPGAFHKWDPKENVWTRLSNPAEHIDARRLKIYAIGEKFYLAPLSVKKGSYSWDPYEEIIWSYNINTDVWEKRVLVPYNSPARRDFIQIVDCFNYKNKLYCIIFLNGRHTIEVFDPSDYSWNKFMDLKLTSTDFSDFKTVVNDGKVYLIAAQRTDSYYSSPKVKTDFYEFDMENKSFIKKNWIVDKEKDWSSNNNQPAILDYQLTAHKGKIYLYGGRLPINNSPYFFYTPMFAVYDPHKNEWSPASDYSYYTAWVNQTEGFFMSNGDGLFLGLGIDGKDVKNRSVFSLSIR